MGSPSRLTNLALLCALAFVLAYAFLPSGSDDQPVVAVDPPPESDDPWNDQAWLNYHTARACDVVESLSGMRFGRRPQVRPATRFDVASSNAVHRELGQLAKPEDEREPVEGVKPYFGNWIGLYNAHTHCVYVVPEDARRSAKAGDDSALLTPDVLRLVLVHEVAHALHHERHPHIDALYRDREGEAARALYATCEGYAQHLTRRAAEVWGIQDAFAVIDRMVGEREAYGQGLEFIDNVYDAYGDEAVRRVIASPPEEMWIIWNPLSEDALAWLDEAR